MSSGSQKERALRPTWLKRLRHRPALGELRALDPPGTRTKFGHSEASTRDLIGGRNPSIWRRNQRIRSSPRRARIKAILRINVILSSVLYTSADDAHARVGGPDRDGRTGRFGWASRRPWVPE